MDYKKTIAANIALLRQSAHLTQAELASRFNYSDKSVSKWERGESIPDVGVLKEIADEFGVTVDWLLTEHAEGEAPKPQNDVVKNRKRITGLAVIAIWFFSIVIFTVISMISGTASKAWLAFIGAIPASSIIMIIFNSIWGKTVNNQYWISLLAWSLITFVFLLLLVCFSINLYMLFVIGFPLQIAVIIWHRMLK